jgi:hypothetical protein
VKIYVAAVDAPREKERQDETQFTTKIANLGPCYFAFVKFSFPVTCLMAYYAETGRSHPPNRKTLQKTLLNA